jgi:hypothetical protein
MEGLEPVKGPGNFNVVKGFREKEAGFGPAGGDNSWQYLQFDGVVSRMCL